MVLANAAAGIYVGAKASTLREGLAIAAEALDSGRALGRLVDLIRATGGDPSRVEANGYA
jgi:anthranilate phosphoribosyltransferase